MRVTGGKAKGYHLKVPKRSIRPTTDLVRGAIFSTLAALTVEWGRVLDLYAGSGSLGIEALSREATWVDFVEREPQCCSIIRENLERTGFTSQAHVYCISGDKALSILKNKYDLIFLDPPYVDPSLENFLTKLAASHLVGDGSILIISHSSRRPLNAGHDGLRLIKEHRYGDTCVSIYRKEVMS